MNALKTCIVITEASSSRTSLFFYHANLTTSLIDGKPKFVVNAKITDYVINDNVLGYYNIIYNNPVVQDHIIQSECSTFYWSLLSTGGMRALFNNTNNSASDKFYLDLKGLFAASPKICIEDNCTDIVLSKAQTITGDQEGQYAWTTLAQSKALDCHAVLDLGGQTAQLTTKNSVFNSYLGKDRAIAEMAQAISVCYNDQQQYNGELCRSNIQTYLSEQFDYKLPITTDQPCKLYVISNFYYYFNDVCKVYLPHIVDNNLSIDPTILSTTQDLCIAKKSLDISMALNIDHYKAITDEVCAHWGNHWEGQVALFAKDICFLGNYNYLVLKTLGQSGEVHIDRSDWAPGAAYEFYNEMALLGAF